MMLKDRVAIITGGGQGIGFAISRLFAQKGASVAIADLNPEQGKAATHTIGSSNGRAIFAQTDVTNAVQVRSLVNETLKAFGGIDILINNAGVDVKKPLLETAEEDWDHVLSVNLKALFLCGKEVVPHMLRRGGGSIVNIASVSALRSEPNFGAYCASKAGVLGLTRSMVVEWSPLGIRINCLLPGPVDAPMKWRWVPKEEDISKVRQNSSDLVPLGRIGDPQEIAEGALWLCSPSATFTSGCFLTIDGGWTCGA
jgi:NAD(P)-dependent dehydrogenase (short-subunit alcohol dehydrogenase family)